MTIAVIELFLELSVLGAQTFGVAVCSTSGAVCYVRGRFPGLSESLGGPLLVLLQLTMAGADPRPESAVTSISEVMETNLLLVVPVHDALPWVQLLVVPAFGPHYVTFNRELICAGEWACVLTAHRSA